MNQFPIISLLISCLLQLIVSGSNNVAYNIPDPECSGVFLLCTDSDKERLGRLAIKSIHEQMDDDKDGMIEASESRDFIHEELQSKTDSVRHGRFQKADLQITFDDLWKQWQNNPVYNWTNDDVVNWLVNHVHLPIYAEYFRRNQIDGRMIPRLAVNEKHYLSSIMQIRDLRHKRRLIIKATDVVLFGPPQHSHNLLKDIILISALLISLAACLYALIRHRKTQESMKTMLKELETLQQAEGDLMAVTGKMKEMEIELKEKSKVDRGLLNSWFLEVQKTKEEADKYRKRRDSTIDHEKQLRLAVHETEQLRIALRKAEEHARHQSYEAPTELLELLRRTYHLEQIAFDTKRKLAENAMLSAKEQMSKISKMQRGFFGAVRIAHTGCMDNIGELINSAKERLADVHEEYEEREKRWNRIASLLDKNDLISNNSTTLTDSPGRTRTTNFDSSSLMNNHNDLSSVTKTNVLANRNFATNQFSTSFPSQDTISQNETHFDHYNTSSNTLKRRIINQTLPNSGLRSSSENMLSIQSVLSSNASNDLTSSTANNEREINFELDETPPVRVDRPVFEAIIDSPGENNDFLVEHSSTNYLNSAATTDDRRSLSSEKARKQTFTTKILKPFQTIRLRKKSPNS